MWFDGPTPPQKSYHEHPNFFFRKGQNLMDAMLPDYFPVPQRGSRKERPETHMSIFWWMDSLNTLREWS